MSSPAPRYIVRHSSDIMSAQHIATYRSLMNEWRLPMAPDRRCEQPDKTIKLRTNPGRLCLWDTRADAQRFSDELDKRTRSNWIVTVDPDESTAHHEAGHAVIGVALDRPIGGIAFLAGPGFGGKHDLPGLGDAWDDPVIKERDIIIRLAGYAAQARHERRAGWASPTVTELANGATTNDGGFQMDGRASFQIADQIVTDSAQAVRLLAASTDTILATPEVGRAIDEVADALLDSTTGFYQRSDQSNGSVVWDCPPSARRTVDASRDMASVRLRPFFSPKV